MTKLLEETIAKVRELPSEIQDMAAEALLMVLNSDQPRYQLTHDQAEGVRHAKIQVDRGEYANDKEVSAMWKRLGL